MPVKCRTHLCGCQQEGQGHLTAPVLRLGHKGDPRHHPVIMFEEVGTGGLVQVLEGDLRTVGVGGECG